MEQIRSIELNTNGEEQLPGLQESFPYIATRANLDQYKVPWHWHRSVELFYVESGCIEYTTPETHFVFPAGSGGFVNANVLHTSRVLPGAGHTIQLLHLFDPTLLSGGHGTQIEQKYILPLLTAPVEIIPFSDNYPAHIRILQKILQAFSISKQHSGYEFTLREILSQIWLELLQLMQPPQEQQSRRQTHDEQIKALMIYIHEHCGELLSIDQLAEAVHISKRLCFRLFQERLHMTPTAYIRSCRLQKACQMLHSTTKSVTEIAYACGFGSSSYFGKLFHSEFGCSPLCYRNLAQS